MKRFLILFLLISSALNLHSQWVVDSLTPDRSNFKAVTFENKVYFIAGETDFYLDSFATSEVSIYNCLTSSWEVSDSITKARSHSACVSGDSAIYVFGGRNFTAGHSWIRSYGASNIIDVFKNGVWQSDSTIIEGRHWGGHGLKVGSKIIFAGMVDSVNYLTSEYYASNKVYIFDELTGVWSIDTLSSPRSELAAATDGTIAIFAGGVNGYGTTSDAVDIYNSVTGAWTTSSLSVPRCYLAGAYANGKFYFAGGMLEGFVNYESDVIDIFDGTSWTTSFLPSPRAGAEAAVVNGNIYYMGGGSYNLSFLSYPNTPDIESTVEVLFTATGFWGRADMNYPRLEFAQTTWGNKIFVAGGNYKATTSSPRIVFSPYAEILDVTTIGITDLAKDLTFDVYPNPSTGQVTISFPENDCEIIITDMLGNEILKTKTTDRANDIYLDKNGIYLTSIRTKHGFATRKILVHR